MSDAATAKALQELTLTIQQAGRKKGGLGGLFSGGGREPERRGATPDHLEIKNNQKAVIFIKKYFIKKL